MALQKHSEPIPSLFPRFYLRVLVASCLINVKAILFKRCRLLLDFSQCCSLRARPCLNGGLSVFYPSQMT
eukprot:6203191-Pleurochrysis_carterae.AAC.1